MVVGVPHGPPAGVSLGLLATSRENVPAVTIGPLGPGVKTCRDLERFIVIFLTEIFYYFYHSAGLAWWEAGGQVLRGRVTECLVMKLL